MASEYLKWLARDVKPEQPRELTKKEKWQNWWHYYRGYVLIGAVCLVILSVLIGDMIAGTKNRPDLQVAYVGTFQLPQDTVEALEDALAQQFPDVNGDDQTIVWVNQYCFDPESSDPSSVMGGTTRLMADLTEADSFLFLMEDPQDFQTRYSILSDSFGGYPPEGAEPEEALWKRWGDCGRLASLELGAFSQDYTVQQVSGDSQDLLKDLYIGRRGFTDRQEESYRQACTDLWNTLTGQ